MWWEWEGDGEETAREEEETPVDFDFISLLAKPKVRRDVTPPTLSFLRFAVVGQIGPFGIFRDQIV